MADTLARKWDSSPEAADMQLMALDLRLIVVAMPMAAASKQRKTPHSSSSVVPTHETVINTANEQRRRMIAHLRCVSASRRAYGDWCALTVLGGV